MRRFIAATALAALALLAWAPAASATGFKVLVVSKECESVTITLKGFHRGKQVRIVFTQGEDTREVTVTATGSLTTHETELPAGTWFWKAWKHEWEVRSGKVRVPACQPSSTTTSSSSTTTSVTTTTLAPTTTLPETTTTAGETTTTVGETTTTAGEATTTTAAAAPTTQGGGPQLPFTGANTVPMLIAGSLLLVAGFSALMAARQRRQRA